MSDNPTMMDAPSSYATTKGKSQASKRRYQLYKDQHGRMWGASVEKSTGDPCSLPERQGWTAPLNVEPKYMKMDSANNSLVIDYERWIRDTDEAHARWHQVLREAATVLYGQGGVSAAIENPQPELLDRIGPQPGQRKEPLEAAMLGNRWILGFTDAKPAWATEFFPDKIELVRDELEITNKYPDAEEEPAILAVDEEMPTIMGGIKYPRWDGPKTGWQLSDGGFVKRGVLEGKEAYKTRALDAEASLHGV